MHRLSTALAILSLLTTSALAEDPAEWGRYAGRHLGNAESAAKCVGYKLNSARRREIVTIIRDADLSDSFEAERSAQRAKNARGVREDPAVCRELVKLYGPRGILIKNYVLPAGAADIANVPGFERGIAMGVDPQMLELFGWQSNVLTGQAIVSSCHGYRLDPYVNEIADSLKGKISPTFAEAAEHVLGEYGQPGTAGFCKKILAEYGPESATPLVVRGE